MSDALQLLAAHDRGAGQLIIRVLRRLHSSPLLFPIYADVRNYITDDDDL